MLGDSLFFGEPLKSIPSYYYFLEKPSVKINVLVLNMKGSWVLRFKFFFKGAGLSNG